MCTASFVIGAVRKLPGTLPTRVFVARKVGILPTVSILMSKQKFGNEYSSYAIEIKISGS